MNRMGISVSSVSIMQLEESILPREVSLWRHFALNQIGVRGAIPSSPLYLSLYNVIFFRRRNLPFYEVYIYFELCL